MFVAHRTGSGRVRVRVRVSQLWQLGEQQWPGQPSMEQNSLTRASPLLHQLTIKLEASLCKNIVFFSYKREIKALAENMSRVLSFERFLLHIAEAVAVAVAVAVVSELKST